MLDECENDCRKIAVNEVALGKKGVVATYNLCAYCTDDARKSDEVSVISVN